MPTKRECTSTGGQRPLTVKVILLLMVGAMMMQPLKTVNGVRAIAAGRLLKTVLNLSGEHLYDDPLTSSMKGTVSCSTEHPRK